MRSLFRSEYVEQMEQKWNGLKTHKRRNILYPHPPVPVRKYFMEG